MIEEYYGLLLMFAGINGVVCGALGVWISAQTGRSSFEGFVLGLLFGQLGVVVAVLLPRPRAAEKIVVQAAAPAAPTKEGEILTALQQIRAELKWQRERLLKEMRK